MIYIIGNSGTGKTFIAQELAKIFNVNYLSASFWIREMYPSLESPFDLTQKTLEELEKNPNISFERIKNKIDINNNIQIIEGLRNPDDFIKLFNPNEDYVIFLIRENYSSITKFEYYGLTTIRMYIYFKEEILNKKLSIFVEFNRKETDKTIEEIKNKLEKHYGSKNI